MEAKKGRLVVIGGGFAGLSAIQSLKGADLEITLIDKQNHHLFQPLLYQVATAGLSGPDIAAPLRHILRKQANVSVLLEEVGSVSLPDRRITLANGTTLAYDFLLLATGARHAYFQHPEWERFAPGLKTLDDALQIRRRLLNAFERAEAESDPDAQRAWLNFTVIGGGPTGVELAGMVAELSRHTLYGEFRKINPSLAHVRLVEAGPRILPSFPEDLSEKAKVQLENIGVEVSTGTPVSHVDSHGYQLGGTFERSKTILWAAGVTASPLGKMLGVPTDRVGRVIVGPDLSVPGYDEVYVAGDLASVASPSGTVPGVAPAAKQMGAYVANAMRLRAKGARSVKPFSYRSYGNLATIGRMAAVADFLWLKLSGAVAWWLWLTAHAYFLIGFRNRFVVLLNSGMSFLTHRRAARIFTADDRIDPRGRAIESDVYRVDEAPPQISD